MEPNTFELMYKGRKYFGQITGIQCRKGYKNKYFVFLEVNTKRFSIYYNNWRTEEEIISDRNIIRYNIDKNLLYK